MPRNSGGLAKDVQVLVLYPSIGLEDVDVELELSLIKRQELLQLLRCGILRLRQIDSTIMFRIIKKSDQIPVLKTIGKSQRALEVCTDDAYGVVNQRVLDRVLLAPLVLSLIALGTSDTRHALVIRELNA